MLCKLIIESQSEIILPYSYNHVIQGFLYKFINEDTFSQFLHDTGYPYHKRIFKLFSYSNVMARALQSDPKRKHFIFPREIALYVSSVHNDFFTYIFTSVVKAEDSFKLGANDVKISNISLVEQKAGSPLVVETLSPVTAYNTLMDAQGRKKTYYINPMEKDFSEYIRNNLIHKYSSYYEREPDNQEFLIKPLGKTKEKVINYKKFIIKGHMGRFELKGSPELIEMALCAGIGSKNSMGFGLITVKE